MEPIYEPRPPKYYYIQVMEIYYGVRGNVMPPPPVYFQYLETMYCLRVVPGTPFPDPMFWNKSFCIPFLSTAKNIQLYFQLVLAKGFIDAIPQVNFLEKCTFVFAFGDKSSQIQCGVIIVVIVVVLRGAIVNITK